MLPSSQVKVACTSSSSSSRNPLYTRLNCTEYNLPSLPIVLTPLRVPCTLWMYTTLCLPSHLIPSSLPTTDGHAAQNLQGRTAVLADCMRPMQAGLQDAQAILMRCRVARRVGVVGMAGRYDAVRDGHCRTVLSAASTPRAGLPACHEEHVAHHQCGTATPSPSCRPMGHVLTPASTTAFATRRGDRYHSSGRAAVVIQPPIAGAPARIHSSRTCNLSVRMLFLATARPW